MKIIYFIKSNKYFYTNSTFFLKSKKNSDHLSFYIYLEMEIIFLLRAQVILTYDIVRWGEFCGKNYRKQNYRKNLLDWFLKHVKLIG